jgi:hypothetical protein
MLGFGIFEGKGGVRKKKIQLINSYFL